MATIASTVSREGTARRTLIRKALLACGIVSSLLYVAMDVIAAMRYATYSYTSQAISELSAVGAPTRPLLVLFGLVYSVLLIAFGVGVWQATNDKRAVHIAGGMLVVHGLVGFLWPFFPMNPRGAERTLSDTGHIVLSIVSVLLIVLYIGFGAAAFGKRWRLYSIGTLLVLLAFGALAGLDGPRIEANLPTPWLGVTERISLGGWLLWVAVLATALLRAEAQRSQVASVGDVIPDTARLSPR
jgi:hypothetical protein